MLRVKNLYYYPLKAAKPIEVETLEVGTYGPLDDRRWMVINKSDRFVSSRTQPAMSQLVIRKEQEDYYLSAAGMEEIKLSQKPVGSDVDIPVWKDLVTVTVVSELLNEWISTYLGEESRIVTMGCHYHRTKRERPVSLADGYPFLITYEESLKELNNKLERPLEMLRFRPNIVLSGGDAASEFSIQQLGICNIQFNLVKPCERCVVINVDPQTGIKGREPLQTLSGYRKIEGKIIFGMNALHDQQGHISVGDSVNILS